MPRRVALFVAVGVIALGGAGYFIFDKLGELESQVAALDRELADSEQQLAQAEARAAAAGQAAVAAESRANQADARAADARREAEAATARADTAEVQARRAGESRDEAERVASEAEQARVRAESASNAAQREAEQARAAEAQAREDARVAREEAEQIRRQREIELNRMQEALNNIVETRRTAIGLVLNLGSDRIEFEFDKAELRPEERELLARISGVLIASADQGYAIQVFGHTDDVGSEEYNQGLSERRADSVRAYLVESGVDPDIITMQGMGKAMPLVEGTDEDARARNRRVEIAIVDTLIDFSGHRR